MKLNHRWAVALLAPPSLALLTAHECWVAPAVFHYRVGGTAALRLWVGEGYLGLARTFTPARVVHLRHLRPGGSQQPQTLAHEAGAVSLPMDSVGVHGLAYESTPAFIELSQADFKAYLEEDGLTHMWPAAQALGRPVRERYSRNTLTLVQAGVAAQWPGTDALPLTLTISPQVNPYALKPGQPLPCRVWLRGQPWTSGTVVAWHRQDTTLTRLTATTDAQGRVQFVLPVPGAWMLSCVHMEAEADTTQADFRSHWSTTVFELGH